MISGDEVAIWFVEYWASVGILARGGYAVIGSVQQ